MTLKYLGGGLDVSSTKIANLAVGLAAADAVTHNQARRILLQHIEPGTAAYDGSRSLIVTTGTTRYPVDGTYTIIGAYAMVNTAPTGASVIVDVLKNGTTIYTTTGNRPTIAASAFASASAFATPDVTSLALGDYLKVAVSQVGSTIAGADLTVIVIADRVS